MFREMRLKDQQLSQEETIEVLSRVTNGIVAINGDEDYPYAVPVSYVYEDGKIYFHGANEGQKYDLLKKNPHVSFAVVDLDDVHPSEFTTYYRSAIAFGDVKVLETPEEIRRVAEILVKKYSPDFMEGGAKYVESQMGAFCVYEMDIKHMTGKKAEEI